MSALLLSLAFTARAGDPEAASPEPAAPEDPAPAPDAPEAPEVSEPAEPPEPPEPPAPIEPIAPPAEPVAPRVLRPGPRPEHLAMREARPQRRGRQGMMDPWGQLQVFTTVWDQDESVQADPAGYGDPEADPGFQLARARFGFTGRLPARPDQNSVIDYALAVGIGTPFDNTITATDSVGLVDAFARYSVRSEIGPTTLALGLMKVPYSRDVLMSSADLVFQERAVGPNLIANQRDVGALASQTLVLSDAEEDAPQIVFHLGAFNGNGDVLGDDDPGLMWAGRVELLRGETYRTWNPAGGTAYGLAVSGLLDDALATRTVGWNVDGLLRLGPWSINGELGSVTLTPTDATIGIPDVLAQTTRYSWVAGTSYWIGLDGGLDDDAPANARGQGIEIAVRASSFDDNARLSDNGDVLIVHGGAIWRNPLPFLDVGAGYIHRAELGGRAIRNDTVRLWTQIRPRR